MKEFPIKFLNLRDKNASHRRSKSVPAGIKEAKVSPRRTACCAASGTEAFLALSLAQAQGARR